MMINILHFSILKMISYIQSYESTFLRWAMITPFRVSFIGGSVEDESCEKFIRGKISRN